VSDKHEVTRRDPILDDWLGFDPTEYPNGFRLNPTYRELLSLVDSVRYDEQKRPELRA
jgi:hypothetical protein